MNGRLLSVLQDSGRYRALLKLKSYGLHSVRADVFLQCFVRVRTRSIYGLASNCECATNARVIAFFSGVTSFFSTRRTLRFALDQYVAFLCLNATCQYKLYVIHLKEANHSASAIASNASTRGSGLVSQVKNRSLCNASQYNARSDSSLRAFYRVVQVMGFFSVSNYRSSLISVKTVASNDLARSLLL